jgi:hypothetical protein
MKHIEAMKQALEALEVATTPLAKDRQEVLRTRAAIREALDEQPAQPSKPLTDAQINLLTDHIYHRGKPVDRDYRICIFRLAEAAYGITGETK